MTRTTASNGNPAKGLFSGNSCIACGVSQLSALPSDRPPSRNVTGIRLSWAPASRGPANLSKTPPRFDPFCHDGSGLLRHDADIGQHQHRQSLVKHVLQGCDIGGLAHLSIGLECTRYIIERREQRLGAFARGARLQCDGLAPPAVIHQEDSARIAFILDVDAVDFVPQFDGEFDHAFGLAHVAGEGQGNIGEAAAIAGPGDGAGHARLCVRHPQCRHLDAATVEARRGQGHGHIRCPGHNGFNPGVAVCKPGQPGCEFGCLGVVDAVGQPDDAEGFGGAEMLLEAGQQAGAIRIERCRGKGCCPLLGLDGIGWLETPGAEPGCRGHKGNGGIGAAGIVENIAHDVLTFRPVLGGGPAVVDHQQQWFLGEAVDPARCIEWMGNTKDKERRNRQAQQHQPPRCLVGLLLAVDEIEQQAEWRKSHGFRFWRREAQQPPDYREQHQPGQRQGCREAQGLQEIHRAIAPDIWAWSIISSRVGVSSVR